VACEARSTVARATQCRLDMQRSIVSAALVFIFSAFVGTALNAYADTKIAKQSAPQAAVASMADDGGGYWALWTEAASH
jgi:hypothetical protein